MGKTVKKIGGAALGGLAGFALGGPAGAVAGGLLGGGGSLLGDLLGGSKTKDVQTGSVGLTPAGQQQFDFAGGKLTGLFNGKVPSVSAGNLSGIQGSIGALQGFSGTQAAKDALNQVGAFRGTPEAFRTLAALEEFGRKEQGFVTDARNAVLSFDEGFQSKALPLLQEAAEGKFLTEQAGNPFIRDLINTAQRPTIENFREQVLPGILSTFAGRGGVGSSLRAGFTAQSARDTQRNLGDIATTIGFNVFESERNKQLAAQQAILGFEDQGLNRQLQARTTNLEAALTTAQQLLSARTAAGQQATNLSAQRLAALQTQAQGQVSLSAQRQASLAAALGGQTSLAGIRLQQSQANAALQNDRVNQLLAFQRNAGTAGSVTTQRLKKGL